MNATTVTFSSDLAEFVAQAGQNAAVNDAIGALGFNQVGFIFRLVLDDNSEIITPRVCLRVAP
ncbi:MAG: hypothetical protein HC880_03980 [Bacteroidia bacterium]|nr:hypothetical protein [Bacteroidia bacterium]